MMINSVLAVHTYLKNSLWKKSKKVFIKDKVRKI